TVRRDPDFGLVLTLGAGGVLVEILHDSATMLLPAPPSAIAGALDRLKIAPILKGFRGKPGADREAIVRLVAELAGRMAADASIAEIEINPLFAGPAPEGVTIVDVLIHDFVH
ncbi:MAG: acetate--CoA ligase family protein, partial [Rhizobiaceae bacterium]|nr:acetate--CoA ligase family protein [Rhizobiaceae bacterium]